MVGKEEGRVGQIYNRLRIQPKRRRVRWLEPPIAPLLGSDVQAFRRGVLGKLPPEVDGLSWTRARIGQLPLIGTNLMLVSAFLNLLIF